MAVALDTLAAVKRLRAARFDEEQAEAVTDLLREREQLAFDRLATKEDLARTEARLQAELKGEIGSLEQRLRAAIADGRTDMIKWFAGVMVAQGLGIVIATVTISRLLASGGQP